MKFKKLVPEAGNCKHWKPSQKGEWIEGYVKDYIKDGFGNAQILLDRGVDNNGNEIETTIPTHTNLQKYYSQIKIGDYIKVTLNDIIPPRFEGNSPSYIYDVGIISSEDMESMEN